MGKIINPIITGFNPDPSICKFKDAYYLATSTFEYFPAVTIYKSDDLVNFKLICNALNTDDLDLNNCGHMSGVYAATLRSNNGLMYMITTNSSGQGHMYVTTSDPDAGIWSKPIFVAGRGFDPDLFFDDDGKVYFLRQDFGGFGIYMAEINIINGKLLTEEKLIYSKFEDRNCEAPHLYKMNNYYYLFVAEGGTFRGHMVAVARSSSPFGNYELCPHNPVLTHRCEVLHPIQSIGHMDLISDNKGHYYAYFLGTRPNGHYHHIGRETFIAELTFDQDLWPHINHDQNIELIMDIPSLPDHLTDKFSFTAQFNGKLSPHFLCRRNPYQHTYFLKENKLHLLLDENHFASLKHRSFLGIRQKNFNFTLSTDISLDCNGKAGLSAIMSDNHHYDLYMESINDHYFLCLRKVIGDIVTIDHLLPIQQSNITLEITATKNNYYFSAIIDHKKQSMGTAVTYLLSAEVASTFNGVVLGMFASGNGKNYAQFNRFSYIGKDIELTAD